MPNVDRFESVFKSAAKAVFAYEPMAVSRVSVVTDLSQADADALTDRVRRFLVALGDASDFRAVPGDRTQTVEQLLSLVNDDTPDLIVTYRNLHSPAVWPHTLGRHLDVLTQATAVPVLVAPHPADGDALDAALADTQQVMAVTDHLAGDRRLVSAAATFTAPGGTLYLTHVEDDTTFDRYIDTISKIPSIDTDIARETILAQLLKEPTDYIASCAEGLTGAGLKITTEPVVTTGHLLSEYQRLITEHEVDLLVMNTKDEDQLAMHGLAYPLAVELRGTPMLML